MVGIGWSFGDIVAGIKVVWDVYQTLSDGPLNAQLEFSQFFDEFAIITSYLDDWESKAQTAHGDSVARLQQQLRQQCETFIKRHMLLIVDANPTSRGARDGRSTWLQNVSFSREQINILYQRVQWPMERKEVTRLRKKLVTFLSLATHSVTVENRDLLLEMKASHVALQESNLKLVSSHLDFVSQITQTFKQVLYSPGQQTSQLDSAKLLRFEEALLPPPPMQAIEAGPTMSSLPWIKRQHQIEQDKGLLPTSMSTVSPQKSRPLEQDERMISERLENLFKRSGLAASDSGSSSADIDINSVVQQILERLWETRTKIGEAVGLPVGVMTQAHIISMVDDPQRALLQELGVWNQFEERVQYEVHRRENVLAQAVTNPARKAASASASLPIPIPQRRHSRTSSGQESPHSISPGDSVSPTVFSASEGSYGSSGSTVRHHRGSSVSSVSTPASIRLEKSLLISLQYEYKSHIYEIEGFMQSISKTDDGEVNCITSMSKDGLTEIRHCLDRATPSPIETSMTPFLDNGHIDKVHKFRVQFQGSHILKFTRLDNQGQHKSQVRCSPIYKFGNKKIDASSLLQSRSNYIHFQELLLNKRIALLVDVELIKSSSKDSNSAQCRLGTIRVLVDHAYGTRSILYFRKTKEQQPAFVEWPTSFFKEPKQPGSKDKTLTLESIDGKSLSISGGGSLTRRSTQGSVTTIGSTETPSIAFSRVQERSNASMKGIKGLVIDFYDAKDCHDFWGEFTVKPNIFHEAGSMGAGPS